MTGQPRLVAAVLDWRATWFLARLALVSAYLVGGFANLADWPGAVVEQAHFGLYPAAFWATVTIAVELIGPALIISGRLVWLGAGMLGAFTLAAAVTANAFWAMPPGHGRFMATNAFFEHLGLVGGFMLAALVARRKNGPA